MLLQQAIRVSVETFSKSSAKTLLCCCQVLLLTNVYSTYALLMSTLDRLR